MMRNKTNIDWSIPKSENPRLRTYKAYHNMKSRCISDQPMIYPYYKAKGIVVCDRWLESFDNFVEDMGYCGEDGFTLDRIDSSKNYTKENCRWASTMLQGLNRSTSRDTSKGVYYHKTHDKWFSSVKLGRKNIHLGCSETEEEAMKIRAAADKVLERLIEMGVVQ